MVRIVIAVVAVVAVAWAVALVVTDGRGASGGPTALAIEGIEPDPAGTTAHLQVECASGVTVEVRDDPTGSGLAEVTVWGTPTAGRCHPAAELSLVEVRRWGLPADAPSHAAFVDGASSQAIDLPT